MYIRYIYIERERERERKEREGGGEALQAICVIAGFMFKMYQHLMFMHVLRAYLYPRDATKCSEESCYSGR